MANNLLFSKIFEILENARRNVVQNINHTMVMSYFEIGKAIVEEEQSGNNRASYGKTTLKNLSGKLQSEFGKGFSVDNLENMRKFYITYSKHVTPGKSETPSRIFENPVFTLSWSHYIKLMRIDDANERKFYEIEAYRNSWSLAELQRQYDSALYTRLALSRDTQKVLELSEKGLVIEKPKDAIKDPYILEFMGLPDRAAFSENDLEEYLINKLEHFLLELGTGFTFVARQKRITFDEKHFRIDLVFYNRILRSFVLIDLKIGELKHQDLGQMQMYVNYFDREIKLPDENKTIGIILCQNKSEAVVRYTLPENNEQIFASKYQTVLPSKEDLKKLLESRQERN